MATSQSKYNQSFPWLWVSIAVIILVAVVGVIAFTQWRGKDNDSNNSATSTVDNRPLEVKVVKPIREVYNPYTEVTVVANKTIELDGESNRIELKEVGEGTLGKYYVARVTKLAIDTTKVKLRLKDTVGNKFEQELEITRRAFAFPAGYSQINGWPDAKYVVEPDSFTGPLNKQNRLFEDYEPEDLVDLNKTHGIYTLNNATMRRDAAAALSRMLIDLRKETGQSVTIASGYR
jgi:hypothetical protein